MKHKHADLIHQWADGAEIELGLGEKWISDSEPCWSPDLRYRIKPEEKKPVVRWLWADKEGRTFWIFSEVQPDEYSIKLEWSRTEFPE